MSSWKVVRGAGILVSDLGVTANSSPASGDDQMAASRLGARHRAVGFPSPAVKGRLPVTRDRARWTVVGPLVLVLLASCEGSPTALPSGYHPEAQPLAVSGGLTFAAVTTAFTHSCGVTTTGQAYCWGSGSWGELGDGGSTYRQSTPTAVSGGLTFTTLNAGELG
jgi:hypothetical protein